MRGRRARGRTGVVVLRTALFTPTLRIYVSLRNVIPSRNDKINSKRRSLQIAARASAEFAEVPRKSAERTSRIRVVLPLVRRRTREGRGQNGIDALEEGRIAEEND